MPPARRKPIPTGTGSSSNGSGGSFAASRTPHAGVIEACGQSAHAYSPENALRVIELYNGVGEFIQAGSQMLKIQGQKTVEEFYLHPGAGEMLLALGDQLAKYRSVVDDARSAFEQLHEKDLERIRNPQHGQERWDIAANRD